MFNKPIFTDSRATFLKAKELLKSSSKKNPIESMDELTGLFSKSCDDIILKTLKEDVTLTYVSGLFKVKLDKGKKHVLIEADLYFQNETGEWIKKENRYELSVKKIADPVLQEVLETGEVVFEINSPDYLEQKEEL